MLPSYIALVATPDDVPTAELAQVAAALNIQVTRDLGPSWGIDASVTPFTNSADVPPGMWQIIVQRDAADPGIGYHLDKHNQPYAIVEWEENGLWTLPASHECCEMLVDPSGNRMAPGLSPDGKRFVLYFLEVCDPCQDLAYAYSINGITVSDFITPDFHQPQEVRGALYDFAGKMTRPRDVLPNGYFCYTDPKTGENYHAGRPGRKRLKTVPLGPLHGASLRELSHRRARQKGLSTWDYRLTYKASGRNIEDALKIRSEIGLASTAAAKSLNASMKRLR